MRTNEQSRARHQPLLPLLHSSANAIHFLQVPQQAIAYQSVASYRRHNATTTQTPPIFAQPAVHVSSCRDSPHVRHCRPLVPAVLEVENRHSSYTLCFSCLACRVLLVLRQNPLTIRPACTDNMDDSPDRIGPEIKRKTTLADKGRGFVRAFTTKYVSCCFATPRTN